MNPFEPRVSIANRPMMTVLLYNNSEKQIVYTGFKHLEIWTKQRIFYLLIITSTVFVFVKFFGLVYML